VSTNDAWPPTPDESHGFAPGVRQGTAPPQPSALDVCGAMSRELPRPPLRESLSGYANALRRHWLAAMACGLLGAAAAGVPAWFLQSPTYTAVSLVQIAAREPSLVFGRIGRAASEDFSVYKHTQQRLLTSYAFLASVIEDSNLSAPNLLSRRADAAAWLAKKLEVEFPDEGEIMRVSLTATDRKETVSLVDGVVGAFLKQSAAVESAQREECLKSLTRIHAEKQAEMRSKHTALREAIARLGTEDRNTPPAQQFALQRFAELQRELLQQDSALNMLESELKTRKSEMAAPDGPAVSHSEIELLAQTDAAATRWKQEMRRVQEAWDRLQSIATQAVSDRRMEGHVAEVAALQAKLDARMAELRSQAQLGKREAAQSETHKLQFRIQTLREHTARLNEDLNEQRGEVERFGKSSLDTKAFIDVEMMRAEVQELDRVVSRIAEEREQVRVESGAGPRVKIVQPARIVSGGSRKISLLCAAVAAVLGACGGVFLVLRWDGTTQRINLPAEVSSRLGLHVVGTIPALPAGYGRLDPPNACDKLPQTHLDESVDRIVVTLLRRARLGNNRAILVSSAEEGEGADLLATQLAFGLARTGRKTVLVDCDLRQPKLHDQFSLPLSPGASEVLNGQCATMEALQETATRNLWMISAGCRNHGTHGALSRGEAGRFFDDLRGMFDFVVIHAAPILAGAETRFLSQDADGVVLSIVRHVSQTPHVAAARKILNSLGVSALEAVVAGSSEESQYEAIH